MNESIRKTTTIKSQSGKFRFLVEFVAVRSSPSTITIIIARIVFVFRGRRSIRIVSRKLMLRSLSPQFMSLYQIVHFLCTLFIHGMVQDFSLAYALFYFVQLQLHSRSELDQSDRQFLPRSQPFLLLFLFVFNVCSIYLWRT